MAESEKTTRRTEEADRARHIAAGETIAFGTTAGTMLLGLLAGIETTQARNDHGSPAQLPPEPAPAPAAPAADHARSAHVPPDHASGESDHHADMQASPAHQTLPAQHADLAAESAPAPEPVGAAMVQALLGSLPSEWDGRATSADHGFSRGAGSISEPQAPAAPLDLGATIHQLADTITGLVDSSLAAVSQTIAQLGDTVGQLASSLSNTLTELGLTGTVSNLTHALAPAEPLTANLLDAPHDTPADLQPHESSLFDTAGAVPLTLFHPPPLQLGFLGQPTLDGHDPHDGAFSALGVHHF